MTVLAFVLQDRSAVVESSISKMVVKKCWRTIGKVRSYSFRRQFNFSGNPTLVRIRLTRAYRQLATYTRI